MSSRGHEREEMVAGVRQVSGAGHYSAMTAGSVDILKNREKNSPKNDSLQGMAGGIPGGDAVGEYALETTRSKEKSAKKPDYFLCLRLKGVRLIPIGSLVVLMPPLPNKVLHRIVQKNPVGKKTYYLFCSR